MKWLPLLPAASSSIPMKSPILLHDSGRSPYCSTPGAANSFITLVLRPRSGKSSVPVCAGPVVQVQHDAVGRRALRRGQLQDTADAVPGDAELQ